MSAGPVQNTPDGRLIGWSNGRLILREIPRQMARDIISEHHYSRRPAGNSSYMHMGLFSGGDLWGVLQAGYAMNPASGGRIVPGTGNREWCELNRMWISEIGPRNTESQAISLLIKYIRKTRPQIRFMQSFADERCGRFGVVYQAANFTYHGYHKSDFYELDGNWYHKIALNEKKGGGARAQHFRDNFHRASKHSLRQFRYIYWLDKRARAECILPEKPYPKR